MSFKARFNTPPVFPARFQDQEELHAEFGSFIEVPVADYWDGDYSVTPTAEEQTIPVIGKTMRHDLTVGAIPSNYGLITWNGSVITVS